MRHAGSWRRGVLREVRPAIEADYSAGQPHLLCKMRSGASACRWIAGDGGNYSICNSTELCRAAQLFIWMGFGNCCLLHGQAATGAISCRTIHYCFWRAHHWRIYFRTHVQQAFSGINAASFFDHRIRFLRADLFYVTRVVDCLNVEVVRAQTVSRSDCSEHRRIDRRQIRGVISPNTRAISLAERSLPSLIICWECLAARHWFC